MTEARTREMEGTIAPVNFEQHKTEHLHPLWGTTW
jgi:hypothetical protein